MVTLRMCVTCPRHLSFSEMYISNEVLVSIREVPSPFSRACLGKFLCSISDMLQLSNETLTLKVQTILHYTHPNTPAADQHTKVDLSTPYFYSLPV